MKLSSSKTDYVAILEAVKEIKLIYYLLREIGVDNVGAMFMAQNALSGGRKRNINSCHH
jgi:hypothetical protein